MLCVATILFVGCRTTKFVADDELLLDRVKIETDEKSLDKGALGGYVKQEPNVRWFGLVKVPLGIYNLAGTDSTKGFNKFLHRLGEAPVILDTMLTVKSQVGIESAVRGKGYLHAKTEVEVSTRGKHAKVDYVVNAGQLYSIRTYRMEVDSPEIDSLLRLHESEGRLYAGMPCDVSLLDGERERIVSLLHREGYVNVLKEFISFEIDSLRGADRLDLTMLIRGKSISKRPQSVYDRYHVRDVTIDVYEEADVMHSDTTAVDTCCYTFEGERPVFICYHGKRSLRPKALASCLYMFGGDVYNEDLSMATYRALCNLSFVKYAIIRSNEVDSALLDVNIIVQQNKVNSVSVELEGTNTSGDFGVAGVVGYTNRNLFKGGEAWTTELEIAYEAIDGLDGYGNNDFFEISLETSLTFPRLIGPFREKSSGQRKSRLTGSSQLRVQYDAQDRPEFHRRVLTGAWRYKWDGLRDGDGTRSLQHTFDVLSVNYVFMPWISDTFRSDYLEDNSDESAIVRYTYEDLFIVNSSYGFVYKKADVRPSDLRQRSQTQFSLNVESAGNLLYLLAKTVGKDKGSDGAYSFFNVAFAQYVKLDLDYAKTYQIGALTSVALHGAFGIAIPYGNSTIIPFEKRYYAGGPNSIRGWSTRELGPGKFRDSDGATDFINQTGNLKLLFNVELRSHLFWKLHGAIFIDAGNVWNTRDYAASPGGQFKFNSFYKEIAAAYGVGARLNMNYFILRLDFGMKAVNPVHETSREHYPIFHPSLSRDLTVHFAVGLPF